jgi:hypothetical protein
VERNALNGKQDHGRTATARPDLVDSLLSQRPTFEESARTVRWEKAKQLLILELALDWKVRFQEKGWTT